MAGGKYVSYLRVSTAKQGASGLGLEAQRMAVASFLNGGVWWVIRELVEVESGKRDDRPKLGEAMALCRLHDGTLVVAKLDRLSRDAAFLMNLQKAGVRFIAADIRQRPLRHGRLDGNRGARLRSGEDGKHWMEGGQPRRDRGRNGLSR